MLGFGIFIVVILFLIVLVIVNIRIVPQSNAYVIERLGGYMGTWAVGLHLKIPFLDRVRTKVSLKEQVVDFPPQPVITKDNVMMQIDTVVYYQVTDPKLFTYGVGRPIVAIENLTATTLRNIIGQLELDESLTSRDLINGQMRAILDEATDPWGIKVNRVEVKNILPPRDIQEAMEKQMRAERERRRAILEAEGMKKAAILTAEGEREARILRAEGEKQSAILSAEGEKIAAIKIAEGQAEAIKSIQKATAEGIEFIKASAPNEGVLALKSFEALVKVADGQSTKLIIPSEMQNLASLVASVSEIAKK
ncbi:MULTISPECIES: SPFH domain-containing protein [unclassified Fusibacter]|uniref:SPFH domain-containing protein n=1 Tax=unclassified Fusibacter TaxID=2624464 RepID=UPI0010100B78|nr:MULTISPECIES: SPFH domain-containing protein [unclassified Fusibacter]MCK8059287.1 SPFH/Band 7/PHB domain protein [Fusibacter sp. A2]NPE21249.1 SPFH/Band 7/PHB domain protein [Fusibacter sp. A1]RXV62514.1 SPFH/Band 7/PHB domain protein [Fusibacter sp. A1]